VPVYVLLETIMHATLTDVMHARATGEDIVQVPVFIFGRCTDGSLAGLRSISIET
jgi:hypothetical protein